MSRDFHRGSETVTGGDNAQRVDILRAEARDLLIAIDESYGPVRTELLSSQERGLYSRILSAHAEALRLLGDFEEMPLWQLSSAVDAVTNLLRAINDDTARPQEQSPRKRSRKPAEPTG